MRSGTCETGGAVPTVLVQGLTSRWAVLIAYLSVSALLWDSGFGRLAAFNDAFDLAGAGSSEAEDLFGIAVIALQSGALVLILSDRWMWLGAVALAGLGVLTFPGTQPLPASDLAVVSSWAIAKHLSVFVGFVLVVGLASVRHGARSDEEAASLPELSWRQAVLIGEGGSRHERSRSQHSRNAFGRSNLTGNAANG